MALRAAVGQYKMDDSASAPDYDALIRDAYATDTALSVRIHTHENYTHPKIDFPNWVLDRIRWRGDERVLDIGAGTGMYLELVRQRVPDGELVAGDLSHGMLQRIRQRPQVQAAHTVRLNAQHLPFPAGTFDVVLANHMLFFVPDIGQALSEIRRVLRPDGCLLASTNSANTMAEFDTLSRRACTLLGFAGVRFESPHNRFTLENGPRQLAHYFRAVARYDIPSHFRFADPEPALAYIDSLRVLNEPQLPNGLSWENFMDAVEKQIRRLIRRTGELRVQKLSGALVATNGGCFAQDYLAKLNGGSSPA